MGKTKESSPHKINLWQALERPPVGAEVYRFSPQIRKIAANTSVILPILLGKKPYVFILKSFTWEVFNQYAEQDLRVGIFVGSTVSIYSGKWNSTTITEKGFNYPWLVRETRTTAEAGKPHSIISNEAGLGFHDNYPPKNSFENVYLAADQNESVYAKIDNQSTLHEQQIEISYNGWAFSPKYLEVFS